MGIYVAQFLTGLASACSLFLIAVGLSIVFGVTRIVNLAHGSLYMLGAYIAYSLVQLLSPGPLGFWGAVLLAALAVGVIGVVIEVLLLRRIYAAPELFQLVATFGVVLVIQDLALLLWGPEDLLGPRAPGLRGSVEILGHRLPSYDFALIALGPLILVLLWLLFRRTRWGALVRAATQDREMVAALGVNQRHLFTGVFFLGAFLAGLGGALQLPKGGADLLMDLNIIAEAFVVVVIGGMGSIPGAFLAALLIAELNAFGVLFYPKITLVLMFLVMALVLVFRPWGLLGRPEGVAPAPSRSASAPRFGTLSARSAALLAAGLLLLALLPWAGGASAVILTTDILIFCLFAASLHFIMGPGGMISFGHAAYFGMGAYGAALLVTYLAAPMEAALMAAPFAAAAFALVVGWLCVRLTGVYLAMLTLAAAQIAWSVATQWYGVTGGDDGLLGIRPSGWAQDRTVFYFVTLALAAAGLLALRHAVFTPFGYALRACRDSPRRAAAIGIDRHRQQWFAFTLAGLFAGLAGALYAFAKGSVFPDQLSIPLSIDALVMVLLGGLQTLSGPIVGAAAFTFLHDLISRLEYWRLILGALIMLLVVAFPLGLAGSLAGPAARLLDLVPRRR